MKKLTLIVSLFLFLVNGNVFSQTAFKDYAIGHPLRISLPDYMSRTIGLNDAAIFQFKNTVKDVAGFIIEDNKEELTIAELNYASLTEFYDAFIIDFLKDQEKRKVSKSQLKTVGENKFIECDASYYDKDTESTIYYFVGIAETKNSYYKMLCFCGEENKDQFKADFQKILYSIKD